MCTISINSSLVVGSPLQQGSDVYVSGTVAGCTSGVIEVSVDCAGGAYTALAQISGGVWSAQIKSHCICDQHVVIQAVCQDPIPCSATYSGLLKCTAPSCCPTVINNTHAMGTWNSAGQRLVTFDTKLSVPAGCSVTVQRDFGDGTLGAVKFLTSGTSQYWETHPYSYGSYTSKLNIISPVGCGLYTDAVSNLTPAPPCATNSWWQTACVVLENLVLLYMVTSGTILTASWLLACVTISPTAYAAALGMVMAAGLMLGVMYFFCMDCECGGPLGFLIKRVGQAILGSGVAVLVFAFPCWAAFGLSAVLIGIGAGLVLSAQWYLAYEHVCPLTICDYWWAYANSMWIALSAAVLVFMLTGASFFGMLLVMVTVAVMLANAYLQFNNHQSAGNC